MKLRLLSFLNLTKPTILLLVALTGAAGLVVEQSLLSHPFQLTLAILGLLLAGGSANSFNQYFEREIDARMERTRQKRPLPLNQIRPIQALVFSIILGLVSVFIFAFFFNLISALLTLVTILFYGLLYTLWLKPRTHLNIVVGGAAGAMAPVIAWTAGCGGLALTPVILFLIIFFWTPSHFWSLAICLKQDYQKVALPMLPVVKGNLETTSQISIYARWTFVASLSLFFVRGSFIYLIAALFLGTLFILKASKLRRTVTDPIANATGIREASRLFNYSIVYLMVLFISIIADSFFSLRL